MNWLPLLLLSLLALVFPAFVLLRGRAGDAASSEDANVALYRERVAEIEGLVAAGDINQEQAEQLIAEQQQSLLQDTSAKAAKASAVKESLAAGNSRKGWLLVVLLGLLIPVLAFTFYQQLGASVDVEIQQLISQSGEGELSQQQTRQLIDKIEERLAREPEQGAYRVMLARLTLAVGDVAKAVEHYRKAAENLEGSAEVQAEYAQALYLAEQGRFSDAVVRALDLALQRDPGNVTALGLRGIKAFEAEDYAAAIKDWQMALRRLQQGSSQASLLTSGIQRARQALGEELPGITVQLSLADGLQAASDQTVYVFARQPEGPPMPLAVTRLKVADLPATVTLNDAMAMPGGSVLSSAERVEVVARVSSSGSVTPQPGDLQGVSDKLVLVNGKLEQPLVLEIDTRLP